MVQTHNARLATWHVWQMRCLDFVFDSHWSADTSGADACSTNAHKLEGEEAWDELI